MKIYRKYLPDTSSLLDQGVKQIQIQFNSVHDRGLQSDAGTEEKVGFTQIRIIQTMDYSLLTFCSH